MAGAARRGCAEARGRGCTKGLRGGAQGRGLHEGAARRREGGGCTKGLRGGARRRGLH